MSSTLSIRTFLLGFLSVGVAVLAQFRLVEGRAVEAALLYTAAVALFVFNFRRTGAGWLVPEAQSSPATNARTLLPTSGWRLAGGLLLLAVATLLAALGLREFHLHEPWTSRGWLFYGGSVAVALLGSVLLSNFRLSPLPHEDDLAPAPYLSPRATALLLALTLLIGLGLRLYRFGELPAGTWYDEAENGLQALRLLEDPSFRPIFANSTHAPAHYIYLIAATFRLFDVSTQSIRLVSVLMGMGTILGGYLAGRELFGRVAGLSTATLLAVSRWDINLSRIGMYNISTPFFALLSVGFFLRGLRRRRLYDFGLAGLCVGLGLAFYAAFQLIALAMVLFGFCLILLEPRVLTRYWLAIMLAMFTAVLAVAPIAQFAYDHPDIYFDRTQSTSIFAGKEPAAWWPAFAKNVRVHALMFNVRGDPNGRHNLPGKPMLDPAAGALFILALCLALWRWRQPRWLLLPIWLGVALLGGVLSLDFEAPQSLRAVGTLPAAYLLAASVLHLLWLAWSREGGRFYPGAFGAIAALLLIPSALYDVRLYFHAQARDFAVWNAFSMPETIAAGLLSELDEGTDAYVSALFHGHPTMRFVALDVRPYARLETDTTFPLPVPADRGLLFLIDAERRAQFDTLRTLYPNGTFRAHRSPYGSPPTLFEARLTPLDLATVQGLEGAYYTNAGWAGKPAFTRQDPTLKLDWRTVTPLPPPFSVEWRGVLRVTQYGDYRIQLKAPDTAQLWIDEALLLTTPDKREIVQTLAEGNHTLRVRAAVTTDVGGSLELAWQPPGGTLETVPAHALYHAPVTANGLLGRYFANGHWEAPAAFARIDGPLDIYFHVTPLPRPYTVEWTGKLAVPEAGRYGFGLESIDESILWIDDEQLLINPGDGEFVQHDVELDAGLHELRVRLSDRTASTFIRLSWRPPWGSWTPVPAAALLPPRAGYDDVTLPSVEALLTLPSPDAAPAPVDRFSLLLPDTARDEVLPGGEVVLDKLAAPKGIAAGGDHIVVADTDNGRLRLLDAAGAPVQTIDGVDANQPRATHFQAPFATAVDAAGLIYVLDPKLGRLLGIAPGSGARTVLPIPQEYLERARGIFLADDGLMWVAHTPGQRVVAFTTDGELRHEIPVRVAANSQPVDVAVTTEGVVYVSDAGAHRLLRYTLDGNLVDSQTLPAANTLEGTHLALTADDGLLYTEPESGRIVQLDRAGAVVAAWRLPARADDGGKPVDVAVDDDGHIWVVDGALGRVVLLDAGE